MENVYIVGAGMTRLGKHLDKSIKQLTAMAVEAVLADAGCGQDVIEAAWFSNTRQGIFEWQHGIRGQCALRACGFEEIPIINTDNACASSSTGLNMAFAHIRAGLCEVALVVGAEKMNYPEQRELMFQAFLGGIDQDLGEAQLRASMAATADLPIPDESASHDAKSERSFFMDVYSAAARWHMKLYGTTRRQIAAVAAKNHWNSQFNDLAQYRTPKSIEEVLADKPVVWPFTRAMCAPMTDGAAALVVCSESAFSEIRQIENLGLCEAGAGGSITERGETALTGRIPVNTSGGLLAKGHPIAATGAVQIVELVTQLRGEAGRRQVANARFAAAENGGGFYDGEEAVTAVTILSNDRQACGQWH